jgi:hypothetical protein
MRCSAARSRAARPSGPMRGRHGTKGPGVIARRSRPTRDLRPIPEHPLSSSVQSVLPSCTWRWVSHNGVTGWSYSEYLAGDFGGERVVISSAPATVEVPVVDYEQTASTNAAVGAAGGAITGALIGGPVGAAIGGVAGAAAGAVVTPPDAVRTYVVENRTDPVYLDGEVVVGAGLPDTVELREVPDYEYRYRYVNGQPVLVDPATRRIVYVYR